jgi:hypothetical protein
LYEIIEGTGSFYFSLIFVDILVINIVSSLELFCEGPLSNCCKNKITMLADSRVALITGGARGIGRALVEDFLEAGYRVSYCDVSERTDSGENPNVFFAKCDVSNEEDVKNWIEGKKVCIVFDKYQGLLLNLVVLMPSSTTLPYPILTALLAILLMLRTGTGTSTSTHV